MNNDPQKYTFQFGDGGTHDASVGEASASIQVCYDYAWLLVPKSTGLNDSPVYSFEVSDDNINWQEYDPLTKDAAINQPFDDTHLTAVWIRINYNPLANTTGTVSFDITLKK